MFFTRLLMLHLKTAKSIFNQLFVFIYSKNDKIIKKRNEKKDFGQHIAYTYLLFQVA